MDSLMWRTWGQPGDEEWMNRGQYPTGQTPSTCYAQLILIGIETAP